MSKEIKMKNLTKIALSIVTIAVLSGCDDSSVQPVPSDVTIYNGDVNVNNGTIIGDTTNTGTPGDEGNDDPEVDDIFETIPTPDVPDVSGLPYGDWNLTGEYEDVNMTLDAGHVWLLDGEVNFKGDSNLTIEPGTVIAALPGEAFLVIEANATIIAEGTAANPITFTTREVLEGDASPGVGQWGGLTVIGNAGTPGETTDYEVDTAKYKVGFGQYTESSGTLSHIQILNSGITRSDNKEINGLSLVGVGSGTTVNDIRIDLSDDDGVEIWGGTVNLTNVFITRCTDDYFDIDEGYTGTVTNLRIDTSFGGNAAVEMSGNSHPTFIDFDIRTGEPQVEEGGFYFKKAGISADLINGRLIHNGTDDGAIHSHSSAAADHENTTFTNVTIIAPEPLSFTGISGADLKVKFDADASNTLVEP